MNAARRIPAKWATPAAFALAWLGAPALAQPGASRLSGSVALGIRSVDTSGAQSKYREDVNLDDGARVLDLSVSYESPTDIDVVDYIDVTASNLGGDPFESVRVDVRKFGAYRLKLERRRSEYFYDDTILPAPLASVTAVTGGDFHRFDFERVRESAQLDITVTPATEVSLGLERQTRKGESETTRDIQRDEFELTQPLDESLNRLRLGVQHTWQRVRLVYEEESRKFDNVSELFLPGASPGSDTTDPAELQFFMLDQAYDYHSRVHTLRTLIDATERLEFSAFFSREDLELELKADESSTGTDFNGVPFTTDTTGAADTSRDIDLSGVDIGYTVGERARLIAGFRSSTLDQRGALQFGTDTGGSDWRIETDGYELGAEYALRPNLIVAGGWSSESRDTAFSHFDEGDLDQERHNTGRDGYFLRLRYETNGDLNLSAAIEDNSIDDPFTLSSPTGSRRYKASVHRDWDNGLSVDANVRHTDVENDRSGWGSDTRQTDVRLSYRSESFRIRGGYGEIELERAIDQLVTGGTIQVQFPIDYLSDAAFTDLSASWTPGPRLSLGGNLRSYENRGSFRIDRDDWQAFVDITISADYALQINYRTIDYVEDSFDDYAADILELAFRLSW